MKTMPKVILIQAAVWLALLALLPAVQAQGLWYVTLEGNDANDCLTPQTPCSTIQAVMARADFVPGDTIFVATMNNTAGGDQEVLLLNRDVELSGGWDVTFSVQDDLSGITHGGRPLRRAVTVTEGTTAWLDHFSIGGTGWIGEPEAGGILNSGELHLNNVQFFLVTRCAIRNRGELTFKTGSVISSLGTAICNHGALTMEQTTVSSNSSEIGCAGIENSGTLLLKRSILDWNASRATNGGGLCNWGTATVVDSTVTYNRAYDSYYNVGGGIHNTGTLTVTNSTVAHNFAATGGGIYNGGTLSLNNVTLANNHADKGGGVYNQAGATTSARNSLLANGSNLQGPDCGGTLISQGYNLVANAADCDWVAGPGDLLNVLPGIGSLYPEYDFTPGGQFYFPLPYVSPAIDAGNPAGCTDQTGDPLPTDQRGVARLGRCDIGAYEYDPAHDPLSYQLLPLVTR